MVSTGGWGIEPGRAPGPPGRGRIARGTIRPMSRRATPHPLDRRPLLIGMLHLPPLPGAPSWVPPATRERSGLPAWAAHAVKDAETLVAAGFDAVMMENFGDAPFFKERVPPETIASMSVAACAVRRALPAHVAIGVNVLRNDASAAVAIAGAAGLDYIRVNILSGAAVTDQGVIEGRAAEVLRLRARLAPEVRILADVRVKHARPLAARPLEEEVGDLVRRGGADAVIVSGVSTGAGVDEEELAAVSRAAGGTPVLIGSGATAANIASLLTHCQGAIVGTSIKRAGRTTARVDARRAASFIRSAGI